MDGLDNIAADPCGVRMIALNQLGFRPKHAKRAAVVLESANAPADTSFRVVDVVSGAIRSEGKLTAAAQDAASGDLMAWADFSPLDVPGTYRLEVCGKRSDEFAIAEDVYAAGLRLTMRAFYGQRCGCNVDLGGGYRHQACHGDGAYHKTSGRSGKLTNTGGWHDAGDYGRYVVNSGISTATLLWAWELYPEVLRNLKLDIPESGGPVPDYLAEIRWNLNWMLSMQDETDGGAWHKQTSEAFCGFIMPEQDKLTSYVIGTGEAPYKSTGATANLAAVAAIAARCFRPFDAAYADRCLAASRKAWSWAMANPKVTFRNPPGISTGGYGDRNCGDEILWASAELFRTTGEVEYEHAFAADVPDMMALDTATWGSVAPMAYWTYCMAEKSNRFVRARMVEATEEAATLRILRANQNGYGNTLRLNDYRWGSNSAAANDSLLLLMAHRLQPNPAAVEAALANLHYLVGCNCFGVSWVTQLGRRPFQHPHHRPSAADKIAAPWPGLLSGGPNAGGGDAVANKMARQPPMKMWLDDQRAYSMNEIAINWNAPLVFLLAAANSDLMLRPGQ
ncbi:MAG TPA: glycoside hydrolase family 9 protein [Terracidiphilus sp.]|nr:glycoside hydrolase family 9 protein [Terracidiphilus sp.]